MQVGLALADLWALPKVTETTLCEVLKQIAYKCALLAILSFLSA